MHILITQAATKKTGAWRVMLLDIVRPYDEVMWQSITVLADKGEDVKNSYMRYYTRMSPCERRW